MLTDGDREDIGILQRMGMKPSPKGAGRNPGKASQAAGRSEESRRECRRGLNSAAAPAVMHLRPRVLAPRPVQFPGLLRLLADAV